MNTRDTQKARDMLVLKNDTHLVFFEADQMLEAAAFRRNHPEFKRRRIVRVLQMLPSNVTIGELMLREN